MSHSNFFIPEKKAEQKKKIRMSQSRTFLSGSVGSLGRESSSALFTDLHIKEGTQPEASLLEKLYNDFGTGKGFNELSGIVSAACLGAPRVLTAFSPEEKFDHSTFEEYVNALRELIFTKLFAKTEASFRINQQQQQQQRQQQQRQKEYRSSSYTSECNMRYKEYLLDECLEESAALKEANTELNNRIKAMSMQISALKSERRSLVTETKALNETLRTTREELCSVKECLEASKARCETLRAQKSKQQSPQLLQLDLTTSQNGQSPLFETLPSPHGLLSPGHSQRARMKQVGVHSDDDNSDAVRAEVKMCPNCERLQKMCDDAVEACRATKEYLYAEMERVDKLMSEFS